MLRNELFYFQVGSVFDLGYLASLHGIASLRGKVDQKQEVLQIPRRGKQNAVDRKIKVREEDESEAEDGKTLPSVKVAFHLTLLGKVQGLMHFVPIECAPV